MTAVGISRVLPYAISAAVGISRALPYRIGTPLPVAPPIAHVLGETRAGDLLGQILTDRKRAALFTAPTPLTLVKLTLLCANIDTVDVVCRGVIYQTGPLVAIGDEVTLPAGPLTSTPSYYWVDLPLVGAAPDGVEIAAGNVMFGVHVGSGALTVPMHYPSAQGSSESADIYADGPSDPFGPSTGMLSDLCIFATYRDPWAPLPSTPPGALAALAYPDAQALLDSPPDTTQAPILTATAWHGTAVDPNRGSFALVRRQGPLYGLVGRRIRVTRADGPESGDAYVVAAVNGLLEDLSLTRRVFAALAPLCLDSLDVKVQVLT